MTYYEEDTPDVSENEVERAENEGMPGNPDWPSGVNYAEDRSGIPIASEVKRISATLEQTDPGSNHTEMMEMLGAMFVQLSRIYDVLMMTLPEGKMRSIDEVHESGGLAASPPILREDAWDDVQKKI